MAQVTVVMATYNWAPVLPLSIASVLDQTFTDFELLVVGDGCTDESAQVVSAIDDPRVHWHNLDHNTGHQSGPNRYGVDHAAGELIAYLGHDDLWLPDHLANLVAALGPELSLVHADLLMVRAGQPLQIWPDPDWSFSQGAWIPPSSVLHHRDLAQQVGSWRPPSETGRLDPENDLWGRLVLERPAGRVRQLSCVKLPATSRQDVYRTRPNHEQIWWLELIRASPDPAAAVAAAATRPYPFADEQPSRLHGWDPRPLGRAHPMATLSGVDLGSAPRSGWRCGARPRASTPERTGGAVRLTTHRAATEPLGAPSNVLDRAVKFCVR